MRALIAGAITLAVILVLAMLLLATDTLLSVFERLQRITPWLGGVYLLILFGAALFTAWMVWRMMKPKPGTREKRQKIMDRGDLNQRIARGAAIGVSVEDGIEELEELDRRQAGSELYLALFGEASAGKSTLVGSLLPDATVVSDPRVGTTRTAIRHHWDGGDGPDVVLVDLPGFGQFEGEELSELARTEAIRAHVVIYLCDADLTRSQFREIEGLGEFAKPIIVALNKADQFSEEELGTIEHRILDRLQTIDALSVVPVIAGGHEQVTVTREDGSSAMVERERSAEIGDLVNAVQQAVSGDHGGLIEQHRLASLQLATFKLDAAEQRYRRQRAETLVDRYSRRAVIGALAAVTPGTDLVIQGALATALVRELTELYEVSVRDIDLDQFVELAGTRVGRFTSISLAVAGNAMKAFPGVGTLAGGLVHAVAYGLIFDSLGRAIASCLAERARLEPDDVLEQLDQQPEADLAARARQLARLALSQRGNEQ